MKKDITFHRAENIIMAVAKTEEEDKEEQWKVFIINRNDKKLETVLITSKGYGSKDQKEQKTSVLRHMIPVLEPGEYGMVEIIDPGVFHLNNEYWVSYYIGSQIYDKKYVFVPDSIIEENLVFIKELRAEGVIHA